MTDPIRFRVRYCETEYSLQTFPGEYRNLMSLLNDRIFPEYFGVCGGQARCGTCIITIEEGQDDLNVCSPAEFTALQKMGTDLRATRLSCQIYVDRLLNGALITIQG